MNDMLQNRGFTLIELMIVVAILGILLGVAIPQYNNYLVKAKRTEGKTALTDNAAKLERYYSDYNFYATVEDVIPRIDPNDGASDFLFASVIDSGNYTITIDSDAADNFQNYTLRAEPIFDDSRCRCLFLSSAGERTVGACPTAPNTAAPTASDSNCW